MNKKGQEEMVGFAVILVIVAIIFLIVIGFVLRKPHKSNIESYEVESFLGAGLQYTTDCEDYSEFMDIQRLVISCGENNLCLDGRNSCEVLNSTLNYLINASWNVGEKSPIKGYNLEVNKLLGATKEKLLILSKGNETVDSKGDFNEFSGKGKRYEVSLILYS